MNRSKAWLCGCILLLAALNAAVFFDGSTKPQIQMDEFVDLGNLKRGEKRKGSFRVSNFGGGTLDILQVDSNCRCLIVDKEELSIPPGESGELGFSFDSSGRPPGEFGAEVIVKSNDPKTPLLRGGVVGFSTFYVHFNPNVWFIGKSVVSSRDKLNARKIVEVKAADPISDLQVNCSGSGVTWKVEKISDIFWEVHFEADSSYDVRDPFDISLTVMVGSESYEGLVKVYNL